MAYKNIHEGFWTSPNTKALTIHDRYLFAYLITNPHSHYSGIYYLPMEVIPPEAGMGIEQIKKSLDTLSNGYRMGTEGVSNGYRMGTEGVSNGYRMGTEGVSNGYRMGTEGVSNGYRMGFDRVSEDFPDFFCLYDPYYQIIFLRNSLIYQLGTKISPKQVKGINNHLLSLQPSPLIEMFIQRYKLLDLAFFYPKTYPIRPFLKNPPVSVSEAVSVSETESVAEKTTVASDRIAFDYEQGTFLNFDEAKASYYQERFPAVDVQAELLKMEAWVKANPKNRKSNWERFIVGWLTKAQDRARPEKKGGSSFDRL